MEGDLLVIFFYRSEICPAYNFSIKFEALLTVLFGFANVYQAPWPVLE